MAFVVAIDWILTKVRLNLFTANFLAGSRRELVF